MDDDTVQHQMTIINGSHHIIINEPEGFMSVDGNKQPVHIKYQSQLTGVVADEILLMVIANLLLMPNRQTIIKYF